MSYFILSKFSFLILQLTLSQIRTAVLVEMLSLCFTEGGSCLSTTKETKTKTKPNSLPLMKVHVKAVMFQLHLQLLIFSTCTARTHNQIIFNQKPQFMTPTNTTVKFCPKYLKVHMHRLTESHTA